MPKTRKQKEEALDLLMNKIKSATGIFVIAPSSINPNEAAELKISLNEFGGEYHLVKNTLFKRAAEELDLAYDETFALGQNALVFCGDQSPEVAKVLKQFAKDTKKAEFKGGYLDHKKITSADVVALAELPSKPQMIAQVLATMNAPLTGFVRVLAANVTGVVTVIDAIKKSKES